MTTKVPVIRSPAACKQRMTITATPGQSRQE
jgi:hypothetical protein